MAFDMQSKGNAATQATSPMGSGIAAGNTAAFPEAPQLNMLQQAGNLVQPPVQTPEDQKRQQMFQQIQQANAPQPVQQAPAQFNGPSQNGSQLSDFLANLLKNRGM